MFALVAFDEDEVFGSARTPCSLRCGRSSTTPGHCLGAEVLTTFDAVAALLGLARW